MRHKRQALLLIPLSLLMFLGCAMGAAGSRRESGGDVYALYFVRRPLSAAAGSDALQGEQRRLLEQDLSTRETAELLMHSLLSGPTDPGLQSPFPQGTAISSVRLTGTELQIDLSSVYGTLSGIGLSLADYAITLTMTQLPDVARVRVTVLGSDLVSRNHQTFYAQDLLRSPKEDVVSTLDARLFFLSAQGSLTPEYRTIALYEGDTQVTALLRGMENGPESRELLPSLPEGFKVRKLWVEEDVCYVSLSSAMMQGVTDTRSLARGIQALEMSLLSLDTVDQVRFLVDGSLSAGPATFLPGESEG